MARLEDGRKANNVVNGAKSGRAHVVLAVRTLLARLGENGLIYRCTGFETGGNIHALLQCVL